MALPRPENNNGEITIQEAIEREKAGNSMKSVELRIRESQKLVAGDLKRNSAAFNVIMTNIADQLQEASRSSMSERADQIKSFEYIKTAIKDSVFATDKEKEVALAAYNSAIDSMKSATSIFDRMGNQFVKRIGDVTGVLSTVFTDMPPIFSYLSTRIGDFASNFMENRKTKRERAEKLQTEVAEAVFSAIRDAQEEGQSQIEEREAPIVRDGDVTTTGNRIERVRAGADAAAGLAGSTNFFGKFTKGFMGVFSKGVLMLLKGMLLVPLGMLILSGLSYVYKKFEDQIIAVKDFVFEAFDNIKLKAVEGFNYLSEKTAEAWNSMKDWAVEGFEGFKMMMSDGYDYSIQKISDGYEWFITKTQEGYEYVSGLAMKYIVNPVIEGYSYLQGLFKQYVSDPAVEAYTFLKNLFNESVIAPITSGFSTMSSLIFDNVISPFKNAFTTITDTIQEFFIKPVTDLFKKVFDELYEILPDWVKNVISPSSVVEPMKLDAPPTKKQTIYDPIDIPGTLPQVQAKPFELLDQDSKKKLVESLKPYTYKDMVAGLKTQQANETKMSKTNVNNVNLQPIVNNTVNSTTHQNRVINMTDPFGGLAAGALR